MSETMPASPNPDDPDLVAARADDLLGRNRMSMARSILLPALQQHPSHTGLLYQLARTDVLDDRPGTPDALSRLLSLEPTHQSGRLLLFYVELAAKRLASAEEIILGLLKEAPRQAFYYAAYARLMLHALDFRKASRLADEALRFAPTLDYCLQTRVLCDLVEGRRNHDSAAFTRLLVEHPDDAKTLRLVVVSLVHSGRSREALRLSQELLRSQPNDKALLNLVVSLQQSNHWTLLPLWPLRKFGWAGSAGLWAAMLIVFRLLSQRSPDMANDFMYFWLGFVIYSWVWPRLLKQWLQRDLS